MTRGMAPMASVWHSRVREAEAACAVCEWRSTERTARQDAEAHTNTTAHPVVVREETFIYLGLWKNLKYSKAAERRRLWEASKHDFVESQDTATAVSTKKETP